MTTIYSCLHCSSDSVKVLKNAFNHTDVKSLNGPKSLSWLDPDPQKSFIIGTELNLRTIEISDLVILFTRYHIWPEHDANPDTNARYKYKQRSLSFFFQLGTRLIQTNRSQFIERPGNDIALNYSYKDYLII